MYLAKDFVETPEGLIFAVVENTVEQGCVLGFLRYVKVANNGWCKVNTEQATRLLQQDYPEYLFYSKTIDVTLHGVAMKRIKTHH